jgi:hypothetical protein
VDPGSGSAAAPAASGSGSAIGSGSATVKELPPARDISELASTMTYESQHRPTLGPTADQVLDAIEKAGIKLMGREQYLGKTMHADFCAGGRTAEGTVVAVCEFGTTEAAAAGLAFGNKTFPGTAATTRAAHRGAVLTITPPKPDPSLTGPAFAAFNAL